ASRVKVLEKQCEYCEAQLLSAEYKHFFRRKNFKKLYSQTLLEKLKAVKKCLQDKSPLPEGKSTYKGCIFCDDAISQLVNLNHAYNSEQPFLRTHLNGLRQKRGAGAPRKGRGRLKHSNVAYVDIKDCLFLLIESSYFCGLGNRKLSPKPVSRNRKS
ncbi:unnamed protein product, partial [Gongylonema pulchrum]|uniref:Zf-AD domain-containing protein n=1 Tax=Gongylonema pulchrum TaxID=637853 RepID=A0A183EQX2_9BILA